MGVFARLFRFLALAMPEELTQDRFRVLANLEARLDNDPGEQGVQGRLGLFLLLTRTGCGFLFLLGFDQGLHSDQGVGYGVMTEGG
jgi:hypothetical protein